MPESALSRLWNTLKPPPPAGTRPPDSARTIALRRRQHRLIAITLAFILVVASGTWAYLFIVNAPQRADKEFQEGMKMMMPGKYPDAVMHFTRALSIYGQLPNVYLERGNAQRILGEMDAALADYQTATELNPTLAAPHNGIAMIYIERNDLRHALERLDKAISLEPSVEAYYERAQILDNQGDHQKAISDYDKAIAERPDAPYMYLARARAKASLGDGEGAHADRMTADQIEHH
jgi:tetratricopeptide (TPR) repeat protein